MEKINYLLIVVSAFAAFGLAALMHTNVWLFETLRYCGALYLLYLAWKLLRSALNSASFTLPEHRISTVKGNYVKGLLIHLTNLKAVLFFGALYSMGVPAAARPVDLISVILVVGLVSASVFLGYGALFFPHKDSAVLPQVQKGI
ncbi:LysE family transporter [Photobacterium sp. SP02]|uniref:LysE family translocator n=1 Tax=Photobacterium sp. SP02 TaxID=3032280 RepID=UPI0031451102